MQTLRGSCSLRRSLRSSSWGTILQTLCASSKDLKGVTQWPKPELSTNSALNLFKFRHKELNGIAASRANHVMVRSAVQAELVAGYPIVKIDLIGEAALCQELESTINSRIADAGIALPHKPVQLFGAEVVTRGEKYVENAVALRALLETLFAEMSSEHTQGLFGQILATRTYVVDPFFRCGAQ